MEVFDPVRRQFVALTPEEAVRQEVLLYLLHQTRCPKGNISVEKQLIVNGLQKRYDVLVYSKTFAPVLLIECKAPSVEINEMMCRQIAVYNLKLQVPYLWLTNGKKHFVVKNDLSAGTYIFLEKLPAFDEL